jgi:hypothetical protein
MNSEQKSVQDVMERISQEHYLGNISCIVTVIVNKNGELEMHMGLAKTHIYSLISGLEILKQNLINDLINNASKPIDKRDI